MSEETTKKLMDAIRAGDRGALDALFAAEPELARFRAPNGSSLLSLTAYMGHPELADVIRKRGIQPDIFEACALGDLLAVQAIVAASRSEANRSAPDGFYPLSLASYFGHRAVVEFLLKNGADVHAAAKNAQKVTALHAGASRGDVDIVRMLLDAGADPNSKQAGGFVALHSAAQNGNVAIVELLLKNGARANSPNDKGKTPADVATEAKHKDLAERLRSAVTA